MFSSSSAGTATVDATYNGNGSALVIRGTLAEVNGYLSGLRVALSNGLLDNNNTYRVQIVADDRLRDAAGVLSKGQFGFDVPDGKSRIEPDIVPAPEG